MDDKEDEFDVNEKTIGSVSSAQPNSSATNINRKEYVEGIPDKNLPDVDLPIDSESLTSNFPKHHRPPVTRPEEDAHEEDTLPIPQDDDRDVTEDLDDKDLPDVDLPIDSESLTSSFPKHHRPPVTRPEEDAHEEDALPIPQDDELSSTDKQLPVDKSRQKLKLRLLERLLNAGSPFPRSFTDTLNRPLIVLLEDREDTHEGKISINTNRRKISKDWSHPLLFILDEIYRQIILILLG